MQRVLVTGASGFIGAAVSRALLRQGCEVAVLLRRSANIFRLGSDIEKMHVVHGGLDDAGSYATGLQRFRPDTVMHLAWHGVSRKNRNDEVQVRTNVTGSAELLWAAIRAGCRTFIGAGSQAEYGPSSRTINEDHPTKPQSLYGAAKLATYTLLDQIARQHQIRFGWIRVFSVYGPHDKADTLISSLITQLLLANRPALTSGEQVWDYLYIDDAADAFVAVGKESRAEGIFNLGSGESRPLHETVKLVRDIIDPSLPLGFGDTASLVTKGQRLEPIVRRLQVTTGWSADTQLSDGLAETIEWHKRMAQEKSSS